MLPLVALAGCGRVATPPAVAGSPTAASTRAVATRSSTPAAPVTPRSSPVAATGSRCPRQPEALSAALSSAAFAAVVRYNERDPGFRPATLRRDRVALAPEAGARGEQVVVECGAPVAARTFVVFTTRIDLLPSQSASQGVWFVSKVRGRFLVWERAH